MTLVIVAGSPTAAVVAGATMPAPHLGAFELEVRSRGARRGVTLVIVAGSPTAAVVAGATMPAPHLGAFTWRE